MDRRVSEKCNSKQEWIHNISDIEVDEKWKQENMDGDDRVLA